MYGSGAATGMENTAVARRPILKVLTMGRTVWFVAAAGTTMRRAVVLLTAPATAQAIAATTLGSACPYKWFWGSTSQQVNESTSQRVNESTGQRVNELTGQRGDEFFEDV